MAAILKQIKQHDNPWKDAEMVKFKLHYGPNMDRTKPYVLPVNINGHRVELEFGKVHEVPRQYLGVINNARLQYVKDSPLARYEHAVGGQGRPQSEVYQNHSVVVDLPMYDVTEL